MSVEVVTFGCRLNAAESLAMQRCAEQAGLTDAILINSCAVTGEAVRQARQAVRRARRDMPDRRIVVTGCAAQTEPERFAGMPEVDAVLGNAEKLTTAAYRALPDFGVAASEKIRVNDIMSVRETASHMLEGFGGLPRAFAQVQNGCDHRCTFCIIPFGRGPSRSAPAGAVVEDVRRLVQGGCREVVLTGVDITAYGADLPGATRLGMLIRAVLKHVPELPRLRLSSLDPAEVDADFWRALAEEERLMPHLHLSLQSGDDLILKRMKRRHRRADALAFCERARRLRPDTVFGADIIAGFPTETEEMFGNTLAAADECDLTYLHVFPFSPREGTPAARMPQIDRSHVKARASRLREAGEEMLSRYLAAQVGLEHSVLVEGPRFGRTQHFAPVALDRGERGEILRVTIDTADQRRLSGSSKKEAA